MIRLGGKVALITGGTAGIGRAAAEAFVREGAKVVITGRDLERARNIQNLVDGGGAIYVRQDTTLEAEWQTVIDATLARFGRIDILVNNAGRIIVKPLDKLSLDDMRLMLAANLDSTFLGMRTAWPHLVRAGGGSIINTSALMGEKTASIGLAYSAAKGAQQALTKAAALEGAAVNIRVNSILPGLIWSDGWKRMAGPKPDETKANLGPTIPMHRVGEPAEIAEAMVFLASDEARFITGIDFAVDGGKSAA
ncbi:MAG: SDR family NAD(P)-dependent oxidoreductase [Rhodospirillaceae bacterium]|nr:SDR family NAD(P)-dependent oxidoreductase [Rhodospirillaceae bacterium]